MVLRDIRQGRSADIARPPRLRYSHVGFRVHDIELMAAFYSGLLGLEVTDRGTLPFPGEPKIVFLSSDPEEHHQVILMEGRQGSPGEEGMLQQLSFRVESLADLRAMQAAIEEAGVTGFRPMAHGTTWSLYFPDPEGNIIECFVNTPWHVRQPVLDDIDLSLSDEEIFAQTEAAYKDAPDFKPRQDWMEALGRRFDERWE